MKIFTKEDTNINVGNIPLNIYFRKSMFPLWKAYIECWVLLPHILYSMNGLYIQHLLT